MTDVWYPELEMRNLIALRSITASMANDPEYLSHASCPYSLDMKVALAQMAGQGGSANVGDSEGSTFFLDGEDSNDAVMREIDRIYTDALKMGDQLKVTDASEKIQLLKARTQMLQKLVELKGQILNVKAMSDFQTSIVGYMEDNLTADQITDFMQHLRKVAK